MHAEAIDPRTVRWVLNDAHLTPGKLHLDWEHVEAAWCEVSAIWVRLDEPLWPQLGRDIARRLSELVRTGVLFTSPDPQVVHLVAEHILGAELGDYFRSHGGQVELRGSGPDWVEVSLSGACHSCPAAVLTLQGRIAVALRNRLGEPVEVRKVA